MVTSTIVVRQYQTEQASEADRVRMIIATEDGSLSLTVPYAPRVIEYGGRGRIYTPVDRPGRTPILSAGGKPLATMAYELFLGNTNPDVDVEEEIAALNAIADSGDRVLVTFGPSEAGMWRITDLSYSSTQRHATTQAILQATVKIEFTAVSDYTASVGPISGGTKPSTSSGSGKATYYGGYTTTVKSGDNLARISVRAYKTSARWRIIADANKIRRPSATAKLKAGSKLKLPKVRR